MSDDFVKALLDYEEKPILTIEKIIHRCTQSRARTPLMPSPGHQVTTSASPLFVLFHLHRHRLYLSPLPPPLLRSIFTAVTPVDFLFLLRWKICVLGPLHLPVISFEFKAHIFPKASLRSRKGGEWWGAPGDRCGVIESLTLVIKTKSQYPKSYKTHGNKMRQRLQLFLRRDERL